MSTYIRISNAKEQKEFIRLTSQSDIIKVRRGLDRLDFSTNVKLLDLIPKIGDRRMSDIICAENFLRLQDLVGRIDILDRQDCQSVVVSGIPECDSSTGLDSKLLYVGFGDVECHWDGE